MLDVTLLLLAPPPAVTAPLTRYGGQPLAHGDAAWPVCKVCHGAMQFVAQVRQGDRLVSAFFCQNRPGVCPDWEADGGANAVWVHPAQDGTPMAAPLRGETALARSFGATVRALKAADYDAARAAWTTQFPGEGRVILGQVGGKPAWLQGDETPKCDACHQPMAFVAQLEEGPYDAGVNFGGGCAYVFACGCGTPRGKALWQQ